MPRVDVDWAPKSRTTQGLPGSHRLHRPAEFAATLKSPFRGRDELFGVYAKPNSLPHGRLGLVVSRKVSPRAVVRNRIKRQIRETFRRQQEKLGGLDTVVVANTKAGRSPLTDLRTSLQQLWDKVEQQCRKS